MVNDDDGRQELIHAKNLMICSTTISIGIGIGTDCRAVVVAVDAVDAAALNRSGGGQRRRWATRVDISKNSIRYDVVVIKLLLFPKFRKILRARFLFYIFTIYMDLYSIDTIDKTQKKSYQYY